MDRGLYTMRQNEVVLYGKGIRGINIWTIWSEENIIRILANGAVYAEVIHEGKAGRSIAEQIQLRINARVRGKLDGGFKRTKEELDGEITNQLGLVAPMLATKYMPLSQSVLNNCYVQPKLDGHRCLMNSDGAYSRRGKEINTIPEILKSIKVPKGMTFDGELYCHGVPLQTISSWAKRRQKDTLKLQYHIYDVIAPDITFKERLIILNNLTYEPEFINIVDTFDNNGADPMAWCQDFRNRGYEGAILRPFFGKYEVGRRSKTLLKVKMRHDDEFECIDVITDKWGLAVLILRLPNGGSFKCTAPGTHDQRKETLMNRESYIGRHVTCEYADLTEDQVPFHCVAIRWLETL